MKKLFFCISLALTGLMTSCVDKYEEVDAESKPSWLGGSIYAELKNPNQSALTGSFNTYLRLVDDLGEAETLNRTGSKTVFPANDEAFERFFRSNTWGVTSYEQLSEAQKKLLLYSSILDNAMLVSMLSNTSGSDNSIVRGFAMKHQTAINTIDTITHIYTLAGMPANNKYWTKYYDKGIDIVCDNTTPMMVHLTREYMVNNNITTVGQGSDFEILTGQPYTEGAAYVFNDRIITKGDAVDGKTCLNGYIHQVENVIVPPGNLAQEIASDEETSLYSRMVDYFSAPFFDRATTNNYNASAIQYNKPIIDSIFVKRYFSNNSQLMALQSDPDGQRVEATLKFDPGWNQYQMASTATANNSIADIAAMFVPNNTAIENYFLPGGEGSYFIDIYGVSANTRENLADNIDALYTKRPDVISKIISNLQHTSFASSVPSKFATLPSDAGEYLGLSLADLQKKSGSDAYDVKFANNGVIYKLNRVIPPDEFSSVFAPASFYPDLQVMRYMVEQPSSGAGSDFIYYLLAMQANYAFLIPEDGAFSDFMYVDPATLGKVEPEAIKFTYVYDEVNKNYKFKAERYKYDINTNQPGAFIREESNIVALKSQINDILNYHTVVLEPGEVFGTNNYYKTKNGGAIKVNRAEAGGQILSGAQIDNNQTPSTIKAVFNETNGVALRLDRIIEAPRNSVYKTLSETHKEKFSKFFEICDFLGGSQAMMTWLDISDEPNEFGVSQQDQYVIFTSTYGTGSNAIADACLDMNVKMFNTYNYTLYAPSNDAMEEAFRNGLPRPTDMEDLYSEAIEKDEDDPTVEQDKALLYSQLNTLRNFVRYHFHESSVYADNVINGGVASLDYNTMYSNDAGVQYKINISGGNGKLDIKDGHGTHHIVDANNANRLSNLMTRDYWFDGEKTQRASAINTSSFCVIHELDGTLNWNPETTRYDKRWSDQAAKARSLNEYKRLKAKNQL